MLHVNIPMKLLPSSFSSSFGLRDGLVVLRHRQGGNWLTIAEIVQRRIDLEALTENIQILLRPANRHCGDGRWLASERLTLTCALV
jgi:hypothetical protein